MNTRNWKIEETNQLYRGCEYVYHNIAQHYGLSDSVFWTLYILHNSNNLVSQKDLCTEWYYSKQTVNSAISILLKKQFVVLELIPGTKNRKNIVLTKEGKAFCAKVISIVNQIEQAAYSRFTEDELNSLHSLLQRSNQYMQEAFQNVQFLESKNIEDE